MIDMEDLKDYALVIVFGIILVGGFGLIFISAVHANNMYITPSRFCLDNGYDEYDKFKKVPFCIEVLGYNEYNAREIVIERTGFLEYKTTWAEDD